MRFLLRNNGNPLNRTLELEGLFYGKFDRENAFANLKLKDLNWIFQ